MNAHGLKISRLLNFSWETNLDINDTKLHLKQNLNNCESSALDCKCIRPGLVNFMLIVWHLQALKSLKVPTTYLYNSRSIKFVV